MRRICIFLCLLLLAGCALPQVSAEDRLFLDLSVDFLGEVILPAEDFEGTPVGGLSALTYDRNAGRFYALSDDRGSLAPSRFYTLDLQLGTEGFQSATIEAVTTLKTPEGDAFPVRQLDPEGIAFTPEGTLMISSEGSPRDGAAPFIGQFDLTGQLLTDYRIPDRYLFDGDAETEQTQGVEENLGFEALTIPPGMSGYGEPFRLFVGTEGPLRQDLDERPDIPYKNRFMHYLIGPDQSTLISEHWYPMDLSPLGAVSNGLSEIEAIDRNGHFLALERAYGLQGMMVKLYQLATGGASDISAIASLKGDLSALTPIQKQMVLKLNDLPVEIDNLEGMALGPNLPDRTRSLILMSDNNFSDRHKTQLLLFRLNGLP
ncbi:MAG: esterase-like activity of phytase family protein [Cyanobacteria bacterium P01_A01_bin.105]